MNSKRDAYVHTRVTQDELQAIDVLAEHLRRTRSDTLRVIALEKAEELGLISRQPQPKTSEQPKGENYRWSSARDAI